MITDPVIGEDFFGRKEILKLLNKRAEGFTDGYRQNIAVLGEPCLGKTSLLHQFIFSLKNESVIPVYVDVRLEPFYDFISRFISTFLFEYLKVKTNRIPSDNIKDLICLSEKYLPKTSETIHKIFDLVSQKKVSDAYKLMFDLPSICKQDENVKFILVMDEFQNLGNFKIKDAFSILGQKIMIQHNTMYVVASSQYDSAKKIMEKKLSLLFGQFHTVILDRFTAGTVKNYVSEKLFPARVDEKYIKFLMDITSGHPFYINVITTCLKNVVKIAGNKNVTLDDVLEALNLSLFDSKSMLSQYMSNCLESLPIQKESVYLLILMAIAERNNKNTDIKDFVEKHYNADIKKPLKVLIKFGFIEKTGKFYKFKDSLFKFWIRYVYKAKFSSMRVDLANKAKYFKENVKNRFIEFLSLQEKDIIERVIRLFEAFENDMIPICSKRKKLPKFDNVYKDKIGDSENYIFAYDNRRVWIGSFKEKFIIQDDIQKFVDDCKRSRRNIHKKIIIYLKDMHVNAKILAKEKGIWIWDLSIVNKLLDAYGMERIIY